MRRTTMHWKTTTLAALIGASAIAPSMAMASPEFDIRGRAHMGFALHDEDKTELNDGVELRRARIGLNGKIDENWDGRIEYDFSEEGVSANDVRLRRSLPVGRIILGQTKVPMGLNQLTSSNSMTFIERSSVSNIIPDSRRMGISYHMSSNPFTFQSMLYSRALGDDQDGDAQVGGAARLVFNPYHHGSSMLHLGLSAAFEDRGDQATLSLSDRPESRPAGVRLISTGDLEDVKSTQKFGVELAWQNGPFSAEAEYLQMDLDRRDSSDPTFSGYHVQASYVLTGESRSYGGGDFGGITPASSAGAWEVAARFSQMDLEDSGVMGGEQENITLGLNYYANQNLRFMTNLIRADIKDGPLNGDETANIALFRAMYYF